MHSCHSLMMITGCGGCCTSNVSIKECRPLTSINLNTPTSLHLPQMRHSKIGADSGYFRFEEPGAAQKARADAAFAEEGGLVVKNYITTLDPVTGEVEREYWSPLHCNQKKFCDGKVSRVRGGKQNRGGRHFNGKHRSRDNNFASDPNKIQKVGAE